mgnify:CR=1 FL=1
MQSQFIGIDWILEEVFKRMFFNNIPDPQAFPKLFRHFFNLPTIIFQFGLSRLRPAFSEDLQKIFVLRRILSPMGTTDAIEFLISKLKQTKTNSDFFDSMNT